MKNRSIGLRVKISKYMSYLLRHNPQNLKIDKNGFVNVNEITQILNERFNVDKEDVYEIVENSSRRRFEIRGNKVRALYGHTIPVEQSFTEDMSVKRLYHGTTLEAAAQILKVGLKAMRRRHVHLSPTIRIAEEVGRRKTWNTVVLEVDVEKARGDGLKFYRVTDKVFLCGRVQPEYIKIVTNQRGRPT